MKRFNNNNKNKNNQDKEERKRSFEKASQYLSDEKHFNKIVNISVSMTFKYFRPGDYNALFIILFHGGWNWIDWR